MLNEGLKRDQTKLFNNQDYAATYKTCYDMCTQRTPYNWSEDLYRKHGETVQKYLQKYVLPALKDKQDEYLLKELQVRR